MSEEEEFTNTWKCSYCKDTRVMRNIPIVKGFTSHHWQKPCDYCSISEHTKLDGRL